MHLTSRLRLGQFYINCIEILFSTIHNTPFSGSWLCFSWTLVSTDEKSHITNVFSNLTASSMRGSRRQIVFACSYSASSVDVQATTTSVLNGVDRRQTNTCHRVQSPNPNLDGFIRLDSCEDLLHDLVVRVSRTQSRHLRLTLGLLHLCRRFLDIVTVDV